MTRIAIAAPTELDGEIGGDTAARWRSRLIDLGHTVDIVSVHEGDDPTSTPEMDRAEALIALHARQGAAAAEAWRKAHPERPTIIGLIGTDLHVDMPSDAATMANVAAADAVTVSHAAAAARLNALDPTWADKTHVVHRSVSEPLPSRQIPFDEFRVVVLADLHTVEDPMLAAQATTMLPPNSRVAVHHGGPATTDDWLLRASAEASSNARYVWHGELNRPATLELLASAHVLACTALAEGGTNLITEAIAMGIPIIGTRIDAHVGLLGNDHPGLFPVGDHLSLATQLDLLELSPKAVMALTERSVERQHQSDPDTERAALDALVRSLVA